MIDGFSEKWACDWDSEEGVVLVSLRAGGNEFVEKLEPYEAAKLRDALVESIRQAQIARCNSPDSPEADEWPHSSDSDSLIWAGKIECMIEEAVAMAEAGERPTLAAVKARLAVKAVGDVSL
jgi:hypothetical protein